MQPYEWEVLSEIVREHMQREEKKRNAAAKLAEQSKVSMRESKAKFLLRMEMLSKILRQCEQEEALPQGSQLAEIFRNHNCYKCASGRSPCLYGDPRQCPHLHARND